MNFFEFEELTPEDFVKTETKPEPEVLPGAVKEEKKEVKKELPAQIQGQEEPVQTTLDESNLEELTPEDLVEKGKKPEKKEEKPKIEQQDLAGYYKDLAEHLVETGDWQIPLEGNLPEDFEWTPENFAQIAKEQNKFLAEQEIEAAKEQLGDQGKELIEFAKNGGKVETLIQSYQTQKNIEDIDTSTIEGSQEVLETYYESLDWSKEEIREEIEALKDRGEDKFKQTASNRKTQLLKSIEEDREQIKVQQEETSKRNQIAVEKFNKDLRGAIHTSDLGERDKKELEKLQFQFIPLNDGSGRKVNGAYLKQIEINSDPAKYAKYLQFLKDFDSFENKTKTTNEVKKKQHLFLRQNQEDLTKRKSEIPETKKEQNQKPAFKFF